MTPPSLDGLLVVDKPVGPTSHDVVARLRRVLGERRIGHTGTLDPLASGVLLLVIGRATRLAQFLNTDAKRYDATIRLGFATDTYDSTGRPTTAVYAGVMPARDRIEAALHAFLGTYPQQPPAFSAKKIDGRRSYRLARAHQTPAAPSLPAPVPVTVAHLDVVDVQGDLVRIELACSAGFYVRSLAHDLGAALGVGAHLAALRRTAASGWTLDDAVPLRPIEGPEGADIARRALIALPDILPELPPLTLTADGVRRAVSGCEIGARDLASGTGSAGSGAFPPRVRLLDDSHHLVAIGDLRPSGLLHPVVVLM
jgi:tRNA pseudouridine55 synthase